MGCCFFLLFFFLAPEHNIFRLHVAQGGFWDWQDTETNAEGTCFNKNISTHLPRHFFQASCDILRWLVMHVGALCLCHMAFLIFSESNRGQTFIFLIKAYGVWRISWIAKSWQDFHTFYVYLFLCINTHMPFLKAGPPTIMPQANLTPVYLR